jgi:hypothetical protein
MLKAKPVRYEPYEPRPVQGPLERVRADEVLTTSDIRSRLAARERSATERLAALRDEVTTLDDLTVAGRPLLDHVRAHPLGAVGAAVVAGAAIGALTGVLGRAFRRDEDEQEGVMRLLTQSVLDEAARRAALGEDPARALERVARRRAPVVQYTPAGPTAPGPIRQSFDLAIKSALGFGVKAGMDALTKQLTGKPEVIQATKEASENPPRPE